MGKRRHTPGQVIGKLREAEGDLAKGKTVGEVSRKLAITKQTYYRWRKEYGGLRVDEVRRFRELEIENGRLKRSVADLNLNKSILDQPPVLSEQKLARIQAFIQILNRGIDIV